MADGKAANEAEFDKERSRTDQSGRRQRFRHVTQTWERVATYSVACAVVATILFVVYRNEPFADPNIVVLLRILLSVAMGVLGATIPGFLRVDLSVRGWRIRAGSALAFAVLTFFATPKVLPSTVQTNPTVSLITDFGSATADLASAIKAIGQSIETQLRTSDLPNADAHADSFHREWAIRVAVMEQIVGYADMLRNLYTDSAPASSKAEWIASRVASIASAAEIAGPPPTDHGPDGEIPFYVYSNIYRAKAATSIDDALGCASTAFAFVSLHLEANDRALRKVLEMAHRNARLEVLLADQDLDLRYEKARDAVSELTANIGAPAEDLERLSSLTAVVSAQGALIAARDQRLTGIDACYAARAELVNAATAAISEWLSLHTRLVVSLRQGHALPLDAIRSTTKRLHSLADRSDTTTAASATPSR